MWEFQCTAGFSLPSPVPNATLISLFVFLRHGSRAPSSAFGRPTIPGDWQCGHRISPHTRVPIVNGTAKDFTFNASADHVYKPSCNGGELLDIGFDELRTLGSHYREYLTDTNRLLPPTYDPHLVTLRATNAGRAILSGLAFFEGLYPPKSPGEPLIVLQNDATTDELLPGLRKDQPGQLNRIAEFESLPSTQNLIDRAHKLYMPIFKKWNLTINSTFDLMFAGDVFLCGRCGGSFRDRAVSPSIWEAMEKDAKIFDETYFQFLGKDGYLPIWRMLSKQIDAQFAKTDTPVVRVFSAHDTTLRSLLEGLGTTERGVPFASNIAVELWHSKQTFVRFVFNGKVVKVNGKELIPLEDFKKWAK
jgi:hypothetical protein